MSATGPPIGPSPRRDAVIDDVTAGAGHSVEQMVAFLSAAWKGRGHPAHDLDHAAGLDGDAATAKTVCRCPVVLEAGNGRTQAMLQGLWHVDALVRTAAGWRIRQPVETCYYAHDTPPGLSSD